MGKDFKWESEDLNNMIGNVGQKFLHDRGKYYPYIEYIRFPHYKILEDDTTIKFNYPLTVFVGANGTNKTSVLQALYGCRGGNSVGEYWFTTDVDKIDEDKKIKSRPHCLIYGYYHKGANKIVEAIKVRINKKDKLDYWEPSRPVKDYKMKIPDKKEYQDAGNKATTRWDQIDKDVIFSDCKKYVSAFDLFFYHANFKRTAWYNTKQDFLRRRAKHLSKVIRENLFQYNKNGNNRIASNRKLSSDECQCISWIMGKQYKEIYIIEHTLYNQHIRDFAASKTVFMRCNNGLTYSEAFAGSGEARIILLIDDILQAAPQSLILVDEPEISIHPEALERLKKFFLHSILENEHQIVISTHSSSMIRELPPAAIKLFEANEGKIHVYENVPYKIAFYTIGQKLDGKRHFYVEDKLAKCIVEDYLTKRYQERWKDSLEIGVVLGGADSMIKTAIMSTVKANNRDIYYLLDGDKNKYPYRDSIVKKEWCDESEQTIDESKIPSEADEYLGEIIKVVTGVEIQFFPSGNSGVSNSQEDITLKRQFLRYWKSHVFFLSSEREKPENVLLRNLGEHIIEDGKEYYCERATCIFTGKITAESIFFVQNMDVKKLALECDLYTHLDEITPLQGALS